MKKRILTLTLSFLAFATYAQEAKQRYDYNEQKKDKSYIQIKGGANYSLGENNAQETFGDVIRYGGSISIGKEYTPYFGGELMATFNRNIQTRIVGSDKNNLASSPFYSTELFVNFNYNLTNILAGIREDRKGHFFLYGGLGIAYGYELYLYDKKFIDHENTFTYAFRTGVTYVHRINNRLSAVAEFGVDCFGDNFNGIDRQLPIDCRLNAQIGLRINLSKKGSTPWRPTTEYFDRVEYRVDTVRVVEQKIVEFPTPVQLNDKYAIETIFFNINSSDIEKSENVKIEKIATVLTENPEKMVLVIGSADRQTGNEKINSELRASRARVVADMLVERFGIEKTRVKTLMGKGEKEDLYQKQYEKNRAAVCIIADFGLE